MSDKFNLAEAEQMLIGGLLLEGGVSLDLVKYKSPIKDHQKIFDAMRKISANGGLDVFSLCEALPGHVRFIEEAEKCGAPHSIPVLASRCRDEAEKYYHQKALAPFRGDFGIEKLPDLKKIISDLHAKYSRGPEDGGFPFQSAASLDHIAGLEIPAPTWITKGLVLEKQFNVIGGPPGCGKSYLAAAIGLCAAAGKPVYFGDLQDKEPVKTLYVGLEGGLQFARRIQELRRGYEIPREAPFHLLQKNPRLWDAKPRMDLLRAADRGDFGLIILDTWRVAFRLLETDKEGWQPAVEFLTELATKCTVLVLHHVAKNRGGPPSIDDLSGAGELGAGLDLCILLRKTKNNVTAHGAKTNPVDEKSLPLPLDLEIHSEGDKTTLLLRPTKNSQDKKAGERREEILEYVLSRRLPVTEREVRDNCGGKPAANKKRLQELVDDGELRPIEGGKYAAP